MKPMTGRAYNFMEFIFNWKMEIGEEQMRDELIIFWSNWKEFKDFLF